MDDLTSIKESLVTETSSLLTLLTNSLGHSESDVETANLLESFWEVLDGDGIKGEERALRMNSTLSSSALDLIPLLSLQLSRPASVRYPASKILLQGIGQHASPREIMIAVGERLEGLVDEMDAWDEDMEDEESDGEELYDYSDSEKGGDEEEEEGSGEEEEEEEDNEDVKTCGSQDGEHDHDPSSTSSQSHSPPAPIKAELPTLLSLFTLAITRLSSNNSLPTIMNLSTLLPPVLARSADINDIVFARIVVERTNELVETVLAWAKGKNDWSEKGEQKSILLSLLASAFTTLYPNLNALSAEHAFAAKNPHAKAAGFDKGGYQDGADSIMKTTLSLIPSLFPSSSPSLSPHSLLALLSSSSTQVATHALLLLSHHLSTLSSSLTQTQMFFSSIPQPYPSSSAPWLDTLVQNDLLSPAGSGSVAFISACLESLLSPSYPSSSPMQRPEEKTTQAIFMTYLPPLATSPTPQFRQLLFSLLSSTSLLHPSLHPPATSLALILPLLSGSSPLPMLRPTGLYFIRSLLTATAPTNKAGGLPGGEGWAWLGVDEDGRDLGKTLEEEAFRLPFAAASAIGEEEQDDPFVWDAEEDEDGECWVRGPGPVFVVLALGIYQMIVQGDAKENQTRFLSPARTEETKARWLTPLRERLTRRAEAAVKAKAEADDEEDESKGAFDTVEFALEGVEKALKAISR